MNWPLILQGVLTAVAVAALIGVWKAVATGVRGLLERVDKVVATAARMEDAIGKVHQPPGLLWDLAVQEDQMRDTRERLIKVETMFEQGVDRRNGPPDRRGPTGG